MKREITIFLAFITFLNSVALAQSPDTIPPPPSYTPSPPPQIMSEGEVPRPPRLEGGISSIEWNGRYWLISTLEGGVVKYEDGEFSRLGGLGVGIRQIKWNEGYWLIGGEGSLLRYDGDFTNLSSDYDIIQIECNGIYCLIYVGLPKQPGYTKLLKYDGASLVDLTRDIERGERNWIRDMAWNGDYWLIPVSIADEQRVTGRTLFRYDGESFTELAYPNLPLGQTLAWNGEYWLITSMVWINETTGPAPRLLEYDGEEFGEIDLPLPVFERFDRETVVSLEPYRISGAFYSGPDMIAWNGQYWLMDTGFSLVKFDGLDFSVERYHSGVYSPYRVKKMVWNGDYWLIQYTLAGTEGSALAKYDGGKIEWLTYEPLSTGKQWAPIGDIGWNGEYWLIGGKKVNDSMVLMKYDGSFFTDLTDEFMRAGQARPPSTPPPPPAGYTEAVFAFLILALIAVLGLIWKAKSKGAIFGAVWGLVGLITYVALMGLEVKMGFEVKGKILLWAMQIIALPSVIWSKIAYQLGGGGSVYYNPGIVLLSSVGIGAILGFVIEKVYRKFKGPKVDRS